jgi:hypothetical protein
VQRSNLVYRGAFRLPDTSSSYDVDSAAYCGEGLAFAGDSLFVSGHEYHFKVGEITIPSPVIATSVGGLPRASWAQPLTSVDKGFTSNLGDTAIANSKRSGGLMVLDGELWVNFYCFYDGSGQQRYSLTKGPRDLSQARSGVFRFAYTNTPAVSAAGATNRYLGKVPVELRAAFGGPVFAGGSTGFSSIASVQSNGPSFNVWQPDSLSGTAHKSNVTAQQMLAYPVNEPLRPPSQQSDVWNFTSSPAGAVIPSGTKSVLFIGSHGIGAYSYPPEAPPYRQFVWAYMADELIAAKVGGQQRVQPYGVWDITDLFSVGSVGKWTIRGVDIDHAANRIYVYCRGQDGVHPLVHVFDVR